MRTHAHTRMLMHTLSHTSYDGPWGKRVRHFRSRAVAKMCPTAEAQGRRVGKVLFFGGERMALETLLPASWSSTSVMRRVWSASLSAVVALVGPCSH